MRIISTPGVSEVLEFENGLVSLVGTRAFVDTQIVGKPIKDLHQHLPKTEMRIIHLMRDNVVVPITGSTIVNHGDDIYFLANKKNINKILREFRRKDKPYKRIMIAGGGIVGLNLAKELENKYNVHVIELNEDRVKKIADELDNTTVLQGNASDETLLLEEGIHDTDLFLAVTNSDETNVIVSILAKQLGAYKTVTLVKQNIYEKLALQSMYIDIVVSPDQITASGFLSYIRRKEAMLVYPLRCNYEVIEVITNKKNTNVVGKLIKEIALPKGARIGCIVRNNKVIMGSGDVVVEHDDHVLVITDIKFIYEIDKLFQVSS